MTNFLYSTLKRKIWENYMLKKLLGRKIAILVAHGFEQSEMTEPRKAFEEAGATTDLISPVKNSVRSWTHNNWGENFPVDIELAQASSADYDALLLPGGVMNPDQLRIIPEAIEFVKQFGSSQKPIAAICHGPWTLINAKLVAGKTVTSWPSLEADLTNAGAKWVDKEVVIDGKLVTSRKPADLPAFNAAAIELFSQK